MDSRLQFKARFRRHFDVREILSEDKFVNNIVEHMWLAWQASREALVVNLPDGNKYHFGSTEDDAKQRLYDAGENTMLKDVKDVLDQAGVRYE